LTNAIACGQHLTPKRIVFSGDTGIFFTHKQEIELLVKFKQFEGCKLEKAKWEKYAMDSDLQIDKERKAYDDLNIQYDNILIVSKDFQKKYNDEYTAHENTKSELKIQIGKKRTWIKIAAASLTANIGLIYILTR